MKQTLRYCTAGVLASCLGLAGAQAQTWDEATDGGGDAGNAPIGTAQVTNGVGALTSITGEIDWFNDGDHVDTYMIKVTDPSTFYASTNPAQSGAFIDDGGAEDDSRLFLFDTAGNLVSANDDAPVGLGGSLESYLSDPTTFTGAGGATLNSPGSVVAGNLYMLAVTYYENTVLDAGLNPIADFDADFDALHGVDPAFGGNDAWADPGDLDDSWTYSVSLRGAMYAIPEPATLSLLAFGGLALMRRRR